MPATMTTDAQGKTELWREFHDVEKLKQRCVEFRKLAGAPGLFHATRVPVDLSEHGHPQDEDWSEFLGCRQPFAFSVDEVSAGSIQQSCFFGARKKLDDYTPLAATSIGLFALGVTPRVCHHRNAPVDRNQWTLALYGAASRNEWQVAYDTVGTGSYAKLEIDIKDALLIVSGLKNRDYLQAYLATLGRSVIKQGHRLPRFIYAGLATDVFAASAALIEAHIAALEAGEFEPKPGVLLPQQIRFIPPGHPATGDVAASRPVTKMPDSASDKACDGPPAPPPDTWPPDDGWHVRKGEFAVLGKPYQIGGRLQQLLAKIVNAHRRPTSQELYSDLWPEDDFVAMDTDKRLNKLRNLHGRTELKLRSCLRLKDTANTRSGALNLIVRDGRGPDTLWSMISPATLKTHLQNTA